jgi:NADH-quinone oxidoreductase subunit K
MSGIGLHHFVLLSAVLFSLGMACAIARRNAVAILIGIELMLNAAALNLAAFSRYGALRAEGQLFVLFVIVLAAAEAVVGLALILAIHRRLRSVDVNRADSLKG